MHVLVVEDDALIRAVMCDALTETGFTAAEAEDSVSALASFQPNGADLLFTDIGLPGSINGWTLAEQIGSLAPAHKVRYGQVRRGAGAVPNSLFVQKPYSPYAVIRQMRALLDVTRALAGKERR